MIPRNGRLAPTHPTTADYPAIEQLRRRDSNSLGFLPAAAIHEAIDQRRTLIVRSNGELVAYALWTHRHEEHPQVTTLVHLVVTHTARRHNIGTRLLQATAEHLRHRGTAILQAWCRIDLPATAMFARCNWTVTLAAINETARQIPKQLWRVPLNDDGRLALWEPPSTFGQRRNRSDTIIEPAHQVKQSTWTMWTKHRLTRPGPPPPTAVTDK